MTERKRREFPRLPRALHAELLRQAGTYGVPALAQRMGLEKSNVYRVVRDGRAPIYRTTLEKITAGLAMENGKNGHAYAHAEPPSTPSAPTVALPPRPAEASAVLQREQDFTLRITLPVKRAERLVAHCDLVGIPLSEFVGSLIDKHLDSESGQES